MRKEGTNTASVVRARSSLRYYPILLNIAEDHKTTRLLTKNNAPELVILVAECQRRQERHGTIRRIRSCLENHISHRINERKGIAGIARTGGEKARNAETRKSRRAPTKQYRVFIRRLSCRSECTIGSQTGRALRRQAGPSPARPSRASRSFCL